MSYRTDSKSLFDVLTKLIFTTEKGLMIDLQTVKGCMCVFFKLVKFPLYDPK